MNSNYLKKYLKYKNKYLNLKNKYDQLGRGYIKILATDYANFMLVNDPTDIIPNLYFLGEYSNKSEYNNFSSFYEKQQYSIDNIAKYSYSYIAVTANNKIIIDSKYIFKQDPEIDINYIIIINTNEYIYVDPTYQHIYYYLNNELNNELNNKFFSQINSNCKVIKVCTNQNGIYILTDSHTHYFFSKVIGENLQYIDYFIEKLDNNSHSEQIYFIDTTCIDIFTINNNDMQCTINIVNDYILIYGQTSLSHNLNTFFKLNIKTNDYFSEELIINIDGNENNICILTNKNNLYIITTDDFLNFSICKIEGEYLSISCGKYHMICLQLDNNVSIISLYNKPISNTKLNKLFSKLDLDTDTVNYLDFMIFDNINKSNNGTFTPIFTPLSVEPISISTISIDNSYPKLPSLKLDNLKIISLAQITKKTNILNLIDKIFRDDITTANSFKSMIEMLYIVFTNINKYKTSKQHQTFIKQQLINLHIDRCISATNRHKYSNEFCQLLTTYVIEILDFFKRKEEIEVDYFIDITYKYEIIDINKIINDIYNNLLTKLDFIHRLDEILLERDTLFLFRSLACYLYGYLGLISVYKDTNINSMKIDKLDIELIKNIIIDTKLLPNIAEIKLTDSCKLMAYLVWYLLTDNTPLNHIPLLLMNEPSSFNVNTNAEHIYNTKNDTIADFVTNVNTYTNQDAVFFCNINCVHHNNNCEYYQHNFILIKQNQIYKLYQTFSDSYCIGGNQSIILIEDIETFYTNLSTIIINNTKWTTSMNDIYKNLFNTNTLDNLIDKNTTFRFRFVSDKVNGSNIYGKYTFLQFISAEILKQYIL